MSRYLSFTRLALARGVAWRWQALWSAATAGCAMVFYVFLWRSIYPQSGLIAGMTMDQMLNYYLFAQALSLMTYTRVDREVSREIASGNILNRLIRPVNLYGQSLAGDVGAVLWNLLFKALPLLAASALLLRVHVPQRPESWLLFAVSLPLAFAIQFNINFLAGISACWTSGSEGVTHTKDFVAMICTGALLPLQFYPPVLQGLFQALPFSHVIYGPLQILQETVTPQAAALSLLWAAAWAAALTLANLALLNKGLRRLRLYGG